VRYTASVDTGRLWLSTFDSVCAPRSLGWLRAQFPRSLMFLRNNVIPREIVLRGVCVDLRNAVSPEDAVNRKLLGGTRGSLFPVNYTPVVCMQSLKKLAGFLIGTVHDCAAHDCLAICGTVLSGLFAARCCSAVRESVELHRSATKNAGSTHGCDAQSFNTRSSVNLMLVMLSALMDGARCSWNVLCPMNVSISRMVCREPSGLIVG